MADPFPKEQQPVNPHGPSHLRNEYHASSTDEEIVQVPNSDTIVPQTQFQHHGDFASFDHGNDKQTDYGIDNVSDDAAFLKRTSVMKTTELVGPSSPKWTLLSRDSIRVDPSKSPSSSLHFMFGQPSKVATRGTPHKVGLEFSQTSTKHSSNASIGPGLHPKEGTCCYMRQDLGQILIQIAI
ncbi:hypothetical protein J1614_003818 [Plenodomus biglobosus]|nr:hypothetical protein J1614_003818 [Plenodomus biglobosus]